MTRNSAARRSLWGSIRGINKLKETEEETMIQRRRQPSQAGTRNKRHSMVVDMDDFNALSRIYRLEDKRTTENKENIGVERIKRNTIYEDESDTSQSEDANTTVDSGTVLEHLDGDTNDATTLLDSAFDDYKIALQALSIEDTVNQDNKLKKSSAFRDRETLEEITKQTGKAEHPETRVVERRGYVIIGTEFSCRGDSSEKMSYLDSDYDDLFDEVACEPYHSQPIQRTSLYFKRLTSPSR
ncbi:hypothetical protein HPODL_01483 [Ogataea parapolymorpha DL-1]|uniref:Uncharacterized protein n=1 Tax=Ogataea parapolymorpha (strain ATCC 26012 / BCRC 20466 / JCM 22074 / NRRL Y-7560 / DL-1) TaxID=871575 RepID=W1QAG1_OGAPD|nr:hypothetical protein HPODL_01483 [Ogataea parapolymorpha DL-1]ESW97384.1 hypothetical protein HPODL_01483 [Ogataea parapolymorpha DL-1]